MAKKENRTPRKLEERINAYFENCDAEGRRYGIYALLVHLGMTEEDFQALEEEKDKKTARVARLARYRILSQVETGQDERPATLCSMALKNIGQWDEGKKRGGENIEVRLIINGTEEER